MAIHNALIAVDFDGTVVTHAYPEIGDDAGAVAVLKELTDNGCRLILYTMRSGALLDKAVKWFRDREIPLYAINENPSQQDFVAEDSCGPLYRRQQLGLSDPVRGRRETAGGGLDQDPGAAGTGGISGLTGRPQVVRRLRNRFPTVVNQR